MKLSHLLVGSIGGLLAASISQAQEDWTRNFRAGLLMGLNIKAEFKTSGQFGFGGIDPAGVGPKLKYDDGYVRVDDTGNAQGYTSYWGYNDKASQYDATAPFLELHSTRSVDVENASSGHHDDSPYLGADIAYGGTFGHWLGARTGWEVGLGFLPVYIEDSRPLSGTFVRSVHQFQNRGNIIMPSATPLNPYRGGPSVFGPVIDDTPIIMPDQVTPGTLNGSRILDVTLLTLRLGPTFYWPLHRRWAVSVSGGGAVGLVTGDYKFNESAVFGAGSTAVNSGKFGKTEATYGGYVSAMTLFHLQRDADLFIGAHFMPMTEVKFKENGREAKLDMSGAVYFTAGINWPF